MLYKIFMALVSLRQLLDEAADRDCAIPAFNVNNLEQIQAIVAAAVETESPVILQASLGARKYAGGVFLKHLFQAVLELYPQWPICIHQDHGHNPDVCIDAILDGYSSVMMDGSLESDAKTPSNLNSNIVRTKQVIDFAHPRGISVEGEVGCLGSLESLHSEKEDGSGAEGLLTREMLLSSLEDVKIFLQACPVDALAIAIGTSHGAAKFHSPPNESVLALDHLKKLHLAFPNQHFVLHGASSVPLELIEQINFYGGSLPKTYGVPLDAIKKSIFYGVRKINIDTDLRLAATASIRQYFHEHPSHFDFRQYGSSLKTSLKNLCIQRYIDCGASGWARRFKVKSLDEMAKTYKKTFRQSETI